MGVTVGHADTVLDGPPYHWP